MYRRMLKISWTRMMTNEEVLRKVRQERSLLGAIKRKKVKYLGHILRHQSLQKFLMEFLVEGERGRGRPRIDWMSNTGKLTFLSYEECSREAQNRMWWRSMVVDLLNGVDT